MTDVKGLTNGDSTHQTVEAAQIEIPIRERPALYNWQTKNEAGYEIIEEPSGTGRPLRVLCVGAGASGINLAKYVQDRSKDVELVIYEKNTDVGGTWLENRYPGCACDIPSVTYQYTWAPAVWQKYYSEAPEIFAYFKNVVDEHKLWEYIKLKHRVDHAEWNPEVGQWTLLITDLEKDTQFEDHCDVFVNAMGFLNDWQWPNIDGLHDFQGKIAHSAGYPQDLDLRNKRVAVVGTGSSGVQIVANIQSEVAKLYTWIRSPTWMTAGFAQKFAGPNGSNFDYTEEQKKIMAEDPEYYLKYRKAVESEMNGGFMGFHKGTPDSQGALKFAHQEMTNRLKGNEKLIKGLIPRNFPVGCKRPTPGNGYLEALIQPNVTVYQDGGLNKITKRGIIDPEGNEQEVDVIILATGFNTSWVPRFPIVANGTNLQDIYRDKPIGYLGVAAPQMPNYFTFYGPYGPLGQGSAIPMIELFANYITAVIRHIQIENIKSLYPRQRVIDDYAEHADLFNKRTVWDAPCRSWFKGGKLDGRIMLHPGTRTQYMELMASPRYQDYEIEYKGRNMWAWLGNGFTLRDYDGSDLTWYMGRANDRDLQEEYDVHRLQYSGA